MESSACMAHTSDFTAHALTKLYFRVEPVKSTWCKRRVLQTVFTNYVSAFYTPAKTNLFSFFRNTKKNYIQRKSHSSSSFWFWPVGSLSTPRFWFSESACSTQKRGPIGWNIPLICSSQYIRAYLPAFLHLGVKSYKKSSEKCFTDPRTLCAYKILLRTTTNFIELESLLTMPRPRRKRPFRKKPYFRFRRQLLDFRFSLYRMSAVDWSVRYILMRLRGVPCPLRTRRNQLYPRRLHYNKILRLQKWKGCRCKK